MAPGTTPYRVSPGVWKSGSRTLSPNISAGWEKRFRAGQVDARGNITTPSIVLSKPKPVQTSTQRLPSAVARAAGNQLQPSSSAPQVPRLEAISPKGAAYHRAHPSSQPTPAQIDAAYIGPKIKQAGYGQGILDRLVAPLARPLTQIGESALNTPVGMIYAGKAIGQDIGSAATGHPSFERTRQMGSALKHQLAHNVHHPYGDLGYNIMNLAALASLGAGTASRASAFGRAASESSGLARASAGARAFIRPPKPPPRTLNYQGTSVELPPSRSPVSRAVQRGHDIVVQRAAVRKPTGKAAEYLAGRVGKQLGQEQRFLGEEAKAPAQALAHAGRKLPPGQETAIRVVANGQSIENRLAFHRAELAKATSNDVKAGIRDKINRLEQAKPFVVNTPQGPAISSAFEHRLSIFRRGRVAPTELQALTDKAIRLSQQTDRTAIESGRLNPEAATARIQAPGRVIGGAKYEAPTPGKLGEPSASLLAKRARVARLQKVYDRALEQSAKKATPYPPEEALVARPRTREEAIARLSELGAHREKLLQDAFNRIRGGSFGRAEISQRNIERWRASRPARGRAVEGRIVTTQKPPTLTQEFRDLAEKQLYDTAEKHKTEPWAKAFLHQEQEIAQLRHAVHETEPVLGAGGLVDFGSALGKGSVPSEMPPRGLYGPTVTRFGAALSVAKDELARHEATAAKRTRPTGLVGAEGFNKGKAYIPETGKPASLGNLGGRIQWAGGYPRIRRTTGSYKQAYTGANLRTGSFRSDTTQLVARRALEEQRIQSVFRYRDRVLSSAQPEPQNDSWVGVRLDNLKSGKTPKAVSDYYDIVGSGEATPAQLEQAAEKARTSVFFGNRKQIAELTPEQQAEFQRLHDEGKIGWVNPKLLSGLQGPAVRLENRTVRATAATLKEANATMKALLIPGRPAYVAPNVLGNGLLINTQQGPLLAVLNLRRAAEASKHLDPDTYAQFRALSGTGIGESVVGGTAGGPGSTLGRLLNRLWSPIVDDPFRQASLLYEITREVGGNFDWAKIDNFLKTAPDQTRVRVAQEGNAALIDYGRMGPNERSILREIIFVYPWMKGSFRYAGRIAREHPAQADLYTQLGAYGQAQARKAYGTGLPSFLKGTTVLGGGILSPLNVGVLGTPQQALELVRWVRGKPTSTGRPTEFVTPVVGMGADIAAASVGRQPFDFGKFVKKDTIQATPQAALVKRLTTTPSPKALYQPRNTWEKISPFLVSGLSPRGYSPATVLHMAETEKRSGMSPVQRAVYDGGKLREGLSSAVKATGLVPSGELPKPLREATVAQTKIQANYARAGVKAGNPDYQQRAFEVDVATLLKWGTITQAQARTALSWAGTQEAGTIQRERDRLRAKFFGGAAISDARAKLTLAAERNALAKDVAAMLRSGTINTDQAKHARTWAASASANEIRAERARVEHKHGLKSPQLVPVP